jgi:hypothetical protein
MVDDPAQTADDHNAKAQQRRRFVWRLTGIGLLALGLLVLLLACVLWIPRWLYPNLNDNDLKDVKTAQNVPDAAKVQELKGARLKLQNDARTTLLQGLAAVLVLTGAGIGASVTLRQVRATRDQIRETATASRNQLKLSEQGQVTDRYTNAVGQLGHEKAPVRLGALYSLERLAQDNPEYRPTVVDVVCAYLRMPYTLPAQSELGAEQVEEEMAVPANGGERAPHPAPGQGPAGEEFQVRQTAQRLLANHLRCPPQTSGQGAQLLPSSPQQAFWPGISLDLTGATLVDFNFPQVSVIQAQFVAATFQGDARFDGATFQDLAGFGGATFQDLAGFRGATLQGLAGFRGATFQGDALFSEATFHSDARFDEATFQRAARFTEPTFHRDARFDEATFQGGARFSKATFQGVAWFDGVTFQDLAGFGGATFQRDAGFGGVTFHSDARFSGATFQRVARFGEATFQRDARFDGATFQDLAGFARATFQRDARFDGATFQGDAGFDEATFQRVAVFGGAHVLHFDNPDRHRRWPDGWTVRPDPTDPSRGTLVRAEHAKEPEPAAPPSDHTDNL